MRAFLVSLALLAGITVAAAVALNSVDMSAESVFSSSTIRH